ncbi:MAG: SatD family protein [Cyclobacteriaceae bacterium]
MNRFVLMGDIIDSSNYPQSRMMDDFKELIQFSNKEGGSSLLSPLTITLGDEFQGVVDSIDSGIKTIIDLEEQMITRNLDFKIRYVVYEGDIKTEINKKQAYEMLGPGLTNARKELNALKKSNSRFNFFLNKKSTASALNRIFKLLQFFLDSWFPKDRTTVSGFLKGLTYKQVAEIEKKDESSLWRRRRSLAIDEYLTCKSLIYEAIR